MQPGQCCRKAKKNNKTQSTQGNVEKLYVSEWRNPRAHFHSRSQTGMGRQTNCYQRDLRWTCNSTSDLYLKRQLECHPRKKRGKERKREAVTGKVVIGNCSWQLFVQAPDFFRLYANPASPYWKTGQVPLMSNLFQSSRVWAWQFTERLEELVITSVTGQLMHITLRHSWRWLSASQ